MSGSFDHISYEYAGHIATITLNRPEQLNTFTVPAMREMLAAFDMVDSDDRVRALIITGAGRAFSAGADLARGPNTFDYASYESPRDELIANGIYRDSGGFMTLRMFRCNKPIIVAFNGAAAGVGATMPLAADYRIASLNARFTFPFTRRGIVPESASSWFLPRIVGIATALDWCLSGREISAQEALEKGLVHALYQREELLPVARELAQEFVKTAPEAVALTRQMLWRMLGAQHPMEAHRVDSRAVQYCGASVDVYEGVGAFLEKREPRFSGSVVGGFPDIFPNWDEPEFH